MRSFIKTFSSLKLAVVLLILIILASILGTLIPQQRSPAEYKARYGGLAPLFKGLQLDRVYRSGWFLTLLVLFALNTVICTSSRLPAKLRRARAPRIRSRKASILALRFHNRLRYRGERDQALSDLEKVLSRRRFRVRRESEGDTTFVYARKNAIGPFGSDIVHLGLLVILMGGIVSGLAGFRTDLTLVEGDRRPVPGADFELRLDKFETELYADGSVKDWKSTLTVLEGDREILTRIIEVNHPLSHRGYVFYQSGYGRDWSNARVDLEIFPEGEEEPVEIFRVRAGAAVEIEKPGWTVTVKGFVPDFVVDEQGRVATRSLEPRNPAALVDVRQDNQILRSGWVFANFPEFGGEHAGAADGLKVRLSGFKAEPYSVIQAARDPGAVFIWGGCILLMLGLAAAFYFPMREIRAALEKKDGATEIVLGGAAHRAREAFQTEFEEISGKLRRGT